MVGGGNLTQNVCFEFIQKILSETFLILTRTERDVIINVSRSSHEVPVLAVRILEKLDFLWTDFRKILNVKFNENSLSRSRPVSWGQTDRRDKADRRFFAALRTRLKTVPAMQISDCLDTGFLSVSLCL